MKTYEPTTFYDLNEKRQEKYVRDVKGDIEVNGDPLLKKMMKTVQSQVKAFETDFYVHDYAMYKDAKEHPFLWVLRPHGTHFMRLIDDRFEKDGDEEAWVMRDVFESVVRIVGHEAIIYFCQDNKMKKVTVEEASGLIRQFELDAYKRKEIRETEEEEERVQKLLAI